MSYLQTLQAFLRSLYEKISFVFMNKYKDTKIIYNSKHFLVINKSFDIKINSNDKNEKTIQTFLTEKLPQLASNHLYHRYYFMHRLDYSTSGIICIPIHKEACQVASRAIQNHQCKKYYVALVRGYLSSQLLDLIFPIGRDVRIEEIEKMCVTNQRPSRSARTLIVALEKGLYDNYPATKILIRPITGRRHQIRVHCSHIGHTIIGDYTYSNKKDTDPRRMYLHAIRLVIKNEVENIDIATSDPFTEYLVPEWRSSMKFSTLEQGILTIDIASKS